MQTPGAENPTSAKQAPNQSGDRGNLRSRFFTAILIVPIVVAAVIISPWGLLAGCIFLTTAGLLEFLAIVKVKRRAPHTIMSLFIAALLWILTIGEFLLDIDTRYYYAYILAAMPIIFIIMLYRPELESSFTTMGHLLLGWAYVLLPSLLFFIMSFGWRFGPSPTTFQYQWQIPVGILFIIWGADIAAYFAGKAFGKHKLFPRISPGKTWEGFAGGAILVIILAFAMNIVIPQRFNWLVIALIVAIFGTYGDLVESMLKRNIGVKDSGGLLPGHGGMLDRFDSFFLSIPFIFLYVFYGLG